VGSDGVADIMESQKKGTGGFGVPHEKAFDAAGVGDRADIGGEVGEEGGDS